MTEHKSRRPRARSSGFIPGLLLALLPGWALASHGLVESRELTQIAREEPYNAGWEFYFDNDVFLGSTKDRNYTGGIALTLAGRRAAEYPFSLDGLLGGLERLSGYDDLVGTPGFYKRHAIEFGLTLFTPDDTANPLPIHDDHPYANLLFIANSRIYIAPERGRMYQSNLMLGLLGSSVGEQVQKLIHRATDSEIPEGWNHQISDGGELTFKHSLSVHQLLLNHQSSLSYDLRSSLEVGLGTTSDLRASLSARWGKLSSAWWSFMPHQNEYINLGQTLSDNALLKSNIPEFYVWGGLQLSYRFYNVLLQGQFRESEVTFDQDQLESLILSTWLGVTHTFSNGYGVSFVVQAQSNEIDLPGRKNPVWGGLVVSRIF
jgi:hypothetical protein